MKSNWEHGHSGVFTRDLENTVRYYQSLGLAPEIVPPRGQSWEGHKAVNVEFGQVMHFGGDTRKPFLQLIYIGDLELEVLRAPIERPQGEALAYGEGCNHVCFTVPDIDGETDILVKKGLRIIQDFHLDDVRLEDYLDTREHGNMLLSFRPLQTEEVKSQKAGYGIIDWKYQGVGAVVKDLEKTVKYYRSMGIADFRPQAMFDTSSIRDVKLHGKSTKGVIKARTRLMQIGPVIYELVEPVEGAGIYKESLDRRGEGIINLTFMVDDLDRETNKLAGKGVSVIFSGKPQAGKAFAYFDTRKDGGDVMIKLVQR
jgi:catechol 2,3-dioxygenase-like lactoylglutathione lyase family enzyme